MPPPPLRPTFPVLLFFFSFNANSRYSFQKAAPQKKPKGGGQEATSAPLSSTFKPAFVGKPLTDAASWLKNKPSSVDLDSRFFAVLDRKAKDGKDGHGSQVVLCRIGDKEGMGDKVQCMLWSAKESELTLSGLEYGDFDNFLESKGEYTPDV